MAFCVQSVINKTNIFVRAFLNFRDIIGRLGVGHRAQREALEIDTFGWKSKYLRMRWRLAPEFVAGGGVF